MFKFHDFSGCLWTPGSPDCCFCTARILIINNNVCKVPCQYLLLAQDPVVSLSLCDRLKPVLGSGGSLLLQLRDGAREDADWLVSEVLSDSDDDDAARLPREEDLVVDDKLPMAAELLVWLEELLGVADKGCVCFDFAKVTANDGTVSGLLLGCGFSWETACSLIRKMRKVGHLVRNTQNL